jgi:hypothetical protein
MAFDEFTIEQPQDLLPKPTMDQRVATGFLRNSMLNQREASNQSSSGSSPDYRMDYWWGAFLV